MVDAKRFKDMSTLNGIQIVLLSLRSPYTFIICILVVDLFSKTTIIGIEKFANKLTLIKTTSLS